MSSPAKVYEFSTITSGTERERGFVGTFLATATPLLLKCTKQSFIFGNIKKIIVTQKKSCIIINEKREILPVIWLFKEEETNGNYFKI